MNESSGPMKKSLQTYPKKSAGIDCLKIKFVDSLKQSKYSVY